MKCGAWEGGSVVRQKELGNVSERSETFSQFSRIMTIIIVKKKIVVVYNIYGALCANSILRILCILTHLMLMVTL